jgi:hypothetical protein
MHKLMCYAAPIEPILMNSNFQIKNFIEIKYCGITLDLHNNFDFIGFTYQPSINSLVLNWQKNIGDWVPKDEILNFSILHRDVTFINNSFDSQTISSIGKYALTDLTFYPSSDRETNNQLIDQESPKVGDDILYIFEGEMFIRVSCSEILLTI